MRFDFFASLRVRLLLLICLAVLPLLGLIFYTYTELRGQVTASAEEKALELARLAANEQKDTIQDTRQLLFALTQLPEVRQRNVAACSTFFTKLLDQYPQYVQLGVIEPDGHIFCSTVSSGSLSNTVQQDYFQRALQSHSFAISDYQQDPFSDKAILNFGYPVIGETGQVEAVVFASLDLAWLNELVMNAQLPPDSTFSVIDHNGIILVHQPEPEKWMGQAVPEVPLFKTILAQSGEGTVEVEDATGVQRLFAFTRLNIGPQVGTLYISIGTPTQAAFADAQRILIRNVVGLALVTLLALVIAWSGANLFILHRVDQLVSVTRRLTAGDLSVRTGQMAGRGELDHLARAFDDMAASLERRVAERDQAETALRASQQALVTLMSNLLGMVYRGGHNQERTMQFVSEGCLDLTGYEATRLMEQTKTPYMKLIHPHDRAVVWQEIQAALQEKRPFQIIYRIITANACEKWVWEQGRGIFSDAGDILALEGFITDTTKRVEAYQALEQRVVDRTRELSALYAVTALTSKSLDLAVILERSLEQVLAVMDSQVGTIHLLDEAQQMLDLAVWQGLPAEIVAEIASLPARDEMMAWIIEQRQSLVVSDLTNDPRVSSSALVQNFQVYAGAPMRARGRVLGVLSVLGKVERYFSVEETTLLSSIADEIGMVTEHLQLYQQAKQLAVIEERNRLARDLHDAVTQSLYSLTIFTDVARRAATTGDLERVIEYLDRLSEAAYQTLKEMRLLVFELRTAALEAEGLVGALQYRLEAVEKRAGIETQLLVDVTIDLPTFVEEGLYLIAQEALNNALKHAAATLVVVRLKATDKDIELEVIDNGRAFDRDNVKNRGGLGLTSMHERTEHLGGTLAIISKPGEGTQVRATIPLRGNGAKSALFIKNFSEVVQ